MAVRYEVGVGSKRQILHSKCISGVALAEPVLDLRVCNESWERSPDHGSDLSGHRSDLVVTVRYHERTLAEVLARSSRCWGIGSDHVVRCHPAEFCSRLDVRVMPRVIPGDNVITPGDEFNGKSANLVILRTLCGFSDPRVSDHEAEQRYVVSREKFHSAGTPWVSSEKSPIKLEPYGF